MKKIIAVVLATFMTQSFGYYDPTNDLITAYCTEVGPYTRESIKNIMTLKEVINAVEKDKACSDVSAFTQSYVNDLITIDQYKDLNDLSLKGMENKLSKIREEIELERANETQKYLDNYKVTHPNWTHAEIEIQKNSYSPSSTLIRDLEAEFSTTKLKIVSENVKSRDYGTKNQHLERIARLNNLRTNLPAFFSTLNNATECRKSNLNAMTQIGAQVLATSGTVFSGVTGSALLISGAMISGVSNLINQIQTNSKLKKITNVVLPYAVGCSLEGIAQNFCKARDTAIILDYTGKIQDSRRGECPSCGNVVEGIELISNRLITFNKWLFNVLAGSESTSDAQANERIKVFNLRNIFNGSQERIKGIINKTDFAIDNLSGDADYIRNETRKLLVGLTQSVVTELYSNMYMVEDGQRNSTAGPYFSYFVEDRDCGIYAYLYSKGLERKLDRPNSDTSCEMFAKQKYGYIDPLSVDLIKKLIIGNGDSVFNETASYINRELRRVLEDNPENIMAKFESLDATTKSTPKAFLVKGENYLKVLLLEISPENDKLRRLVEQTLAKFSKGLSISSDKDISAGTQVTELGLLLAPNQQVLSLENAIREIVKQDIDIKLAEGKIPGEYLRYLLKTNYENSSEYLIRNFLNIQVLKDDILEAKRITEVNLNSMANYFEDEIVEGIEKLQKAGQTNLVGKRCVEALLAPNTAKYMKRGVFIKRPKLKRICKGAIYQSAIPEKVSSLKFDELWGQPFESRVCTIYDFKRKLRLMELSR